MIIITDTREQKPFWTTHKHFLTVGDYTTWNLRNKFHIERKSPSDLYGTLLGGHTQFRNELLRAHDKGITLVVYIECTKEKFISKEWSGSRYCKMDCATVVRCIDTMSKKYTTEFVWCTSRNDCKKKVFARLQLAEKKPTKSGKSN